MADTGDSKMSSYARLNDRGTKISLSATAPPPSKRRTGIVHYVCDRPSLASSAIGEKIVFNCCLAHNGSKYELFTAVVMPDHAHLLFCPLRRPDGWCWCLPGIMHAIKGASARSINKLLRRKGAVWQEESFDHVLRSDESLDQKVDYICNNPVRAGLVSSADQYPWLWRASVGSASVGTGL